MLRLKQEPCIEPSELLISALGERCTTREFISITSMRRLSPATKRALTSVSHLLSNVLGSTSCTVVAGSSVSLWSHVARALNTSEPVLQASILLLLAI
jgi:hypothetical protein